MKNKARKIWIRIAIFSIILGVIIFGGMMTVLKWDFSKLSNAKLETAEYEISETFTNISLQVRVEDIRIVPSEDGKCKVVCYEEKKVTHSAAVQDGTLVIKTLNQKSWYDYIRLYSPATKITVYLPNAEYGALSVEAKTSDIEIAKEFTFDSIKLSVSTGDAICYANAKNAVNIKTTTGSVRVENVEVGSLNVSVSTGRVNMTGIACEDDLSITVSTGKVIAKNITCKNLTTKGDTGDTFLENTVASERFSIKRSTGDVRFDGCDAGELVVETDTGDVTGTLLSEKMFIAKTDTGRVEVPKTTNGGKCEITTDTGDIKISIKQP